MAKKVWDGFKTGWLLPLYELQFAARALLFLEVKNTYIVSGSGCIYS
uniref:Uncharacterized protein n=1 Tax=uncultured Desulfobacterium sp. TaxID=201089 RepID=E1YAH0_9BACT|nr:unknown protein [uncultured Desulfobacterium sp.]